MNKVTEDKNLGRKKTQCTPVSEELMNWEWEGKTGSGKSKINGCSDFPGGPVVKNPPADAGDTGSIPRWGRFHMPQGS